MQKSLTSTQYSCTYAVFLYLCNIPILMQYSYTYAIFLYLCNIPILMQYSYTSTDEHAKKGELKELLDLFKPYRAIGRIMELDHCSVAAGLRMWLAVQSQAKPSHRLILYDRLIRVLRVEHVIIGMLSPLIEWSSMHIRNTVTPPFILPPVSVLLEV